LEGIEEAGEGYFEGGVRVWGGGVDGVDRVDKVDKVDQLTS
jgi:hypothetical protein